MRVLLIGGIGLGHLPRGGEEYKNQVLMRQLEAALSCVSIDTSAWKSDPGVILRILFHLLFRSYDNIILSASSKSVYQLLQFIHLFPRIRKKTSYFVIGGFFPDALQKGIYRKKYYEKLKAIVVEGEILRKPLLESGLHNTFILPNFKMFPDVLIPQRGEEPARFVFLSKICREKGADTVLDAVDLLHQEGYEGRFTIGFYGVIDNGFRQEFESRLSQQVTYGGLIDLINETEASYAQLANYHCLLFPTHWSGEGFPGVLIDSYVAGLPVIASDWNMNRELVREGETGIMIEPENPAQLAAAMKTLINDPGMRQRMGRMAKQEAPKFHINGVWPEIKKILN